MGHIHVSKVDYNLVDNFIAEIHAEKGLSQSSLKKHAEKGLSQSSLKKYVVLVRKVLKEAERGGTIDHSPCQSALNIDPLSACNVDPFGDARRRSYR